MSHLALAFVTLTVMTPCHHALKRAEADPAAPASLVSIAAGICVQGKRSILENALEYYKRSPLAELWNGATLDDESCEKAGYPAHLGDEHCVDGATRWTSVNQTPEQFMSEKHAQTKWMEDTGSDFPKYSAEMDAICKHSLKEGVVENSLVSTAAGICIQGKRSILENALKKYKKSPLADTWNGATLNDESCEKAGYPVNLGDQYCVDGATRWTSVNQTPEQFMFAKNAKTKWMEDTGSDLAKYSAEMDAICEHSIASTATGICVQGKRSILENALKKYKKSPLADTWHRVSPEFRSCEAAGFPAHLGDEHCVDGATRWTSVKQTPEQFMFEKNAKMKWMADTGSDLAKYSAEMDAICEH